MANKKVGHLEIDGVEYYPRPSFPVGFVIITNKEINPKEEFGGEWAKFALGKTLVGVNPNDSAFNAPNKTGGHKELQSHYHTGSTSEAGWHTHGVPWWISSVSSNQYCVEGWRTKQIQGSFETYGAGSHTHSFTTNSAGGGNGGNMPPYVTVYFYVRTA